MQTNFHNFHEVDNVSVIGYEWDSSFCSGVVNGGTKLRGKVLITHILKKVTYDEGQILLLVLLKSGKSRPDNHQTTPLFSVILRKLGGEGMKFQLR